MVHCVLIIHLYIFHFDVVWGLANVGRTLNARTCLIMVSYYVSYGSTAFLWPFTVSQFQFSYHLHKNTTCCRAGYRSS